MTADALRAELLSVAGVASAEVDVANGSPAGVKVQLAPGADSRRVGVEVQRILAAHGLRSRFASPGDPSPAAASTPDAGPAVPPPPPLAPATPPPPPIEPVPAAPSTPVSAPPEVAAPAAAPEWAPPVIVATAAEVPPHPTMSVVPSPPTAAPPSAPPRLQSVALEERADGLTAVVSLANGRQATRSFGFDSDGLDEAVVGAFVEAAGRSVEVLAVEWFQVDGVSVVTVVLQREDGVMTAGAGVMRSGRAFAVAAAARAALDA